MTRSDIADVFENAAIASAVAVTAGVVIVTMASISLFSFAVASFALGDAS